MATEDDQPNDQAEQFAALITGLVAAGRALYTAAEPTIRKVNAEANRLRAAAEPRLAELSGHVERGRAAAEPTLRQISDDITRFRAATEPTVLVVFDRIERACAAAQPALNRANEIADRVRKWTQENGPTIAEVIVGMQYFAAHAHVENWEDLEPVDWEKAIELMRADDGVPLAWIPPSHVVKALVDADDHAARDAVLLAYSDEIAQACRDVVENVTIDRLNDLHGMLDEAWSAYDAGLFRPAQAGAAAAVTEVINEYLNDQFIGHEFREFTQRLKQYREAAPETWAVTEVRMTAVLCGVSTAAQHTNFGHPGFNRHASAHGVSSTAYTPVNCLRGLMLATSAARELQFWFSDEWTQPARRSAQQVAAITAARHRAA